MSLWFSYKNLMKTCSRWLGAGLPLFCLSAGANAQLSEDVEVRRDGANAIASVRFVIPIQYRRTVTSRAGDLGQVFYNVLPARDNPSLLAGQRKIISGDGLPQIVITDETVDSTSLNRKLVISFTAPTRYSVRAGRGNKTIEIVLEGLGAAVRLPSASATPTPASQAPRPYVVTIPASPQSDPSVGISIPATLHDYETFTSTRLVDGTPVLDTHVGYFASLPEAESARNLLLRRFPNAVVATLPSTPSSTLATLPPQTADQPGAMTPAELNDRAQTLLAAGKAAFDRGDNAAALAPLSELLNLAPTSSTREAQELIGQARLKLGDIAGARSEFELFLTLYPAGQASDRIRAQLASLPEKVAEKVAASEVKVAEEPVSPGAARCQLSITAARRKPGRRSFRIRPSAVCRNWPIATISPTPSKSSFRPRSI